LSQVADVAAELLEQAGRQRQQRHPRKQERPRGLQLGGDQRLGDLHQWNPANDLEQAEDQRAICEVAPADAQAACDQPAQPQRDEDLEQNCRDRRGDQAWAELK
jgi:hypothetical protein